MTISRTLATFGRRGPVSQYGTARMLGAEPAASPPKPDAPPAAPPPAASHEDACSVTAWYDDPPLDPKTGKPTGGMATSTMAYLVMGIPAVAGLALGAGLAKNHRVVGGLVGGVVGFLAGAGVDTYQYNQWKEAGGAKHVKGACAASPAAAPPAAAPPAAQPAPDASPDAGTAVPGEDQLASPCPSSGSSRTATSTGI